MSAIVAGLLGLAPAQALADDDALTVRIGTTARNTTASVAQWGASLVYMHLSYTNLVELQFGGEITPGFAESWSVSDDGLTWTFKIRPGMLWSDGEPADANDAAFTINYLLDSIGDENQLRGFVNPYFWTTNGESAIAEVSAPDAETLLVTTRTVQPLFLWKIFVVLPEHIWKDVSYADALGTFQAEPPIVGSGPFILTEWKPNEFLRLTRNDHWWGPAPAVEEVLIVEYASPDAEIQALLAGEIDMAMDGRAGDVQQLSADPNIEVVAGQSANQRTLGFNTLGIAGGANTEATADPAFRDAIGYAIDQAVIVDKVYAGLAQPGLGFLAPLDPNFDPMTDIARRFDLAEATKRLDAAGYPLNADGVRVDKSGKPLDLRMVLSNISPEYSTAGQFITEWLAQIGIKVTPVAMDEAAFFDTWAVNRAWELNLDRFSLPPGPMASGSVPRTPPPDCGTCWQSEEWTAMYDEFMQTTDEAAANALLKDMNRLFYQEAPVIQLAFPDTIQPHRTDRFTNWTRTPAEIGPLYSADGFSSAIDLFTKLTPVSAETAAPSTATATDAPSTGASAAPTASPSEPTGGSGGDNTGLLAIVAIVAVAGVGGFLLLRRRRA